METKEVKPYISQWYLINEEDMYGVPNREIHIRKN